MIPLDSMDLQLALQGKHSFGAYAVIECAHSVSDIFTSYRVSTSYGGDILPNAECRVFSEMHTWHSHLNMTRRSEMHRFVRTLDMLMMFFPDEMLTMFCQNTNKYAWMKIFEKPSYAQPDGCWPEVMPPPWDVALHSTADLHEHRSSCFGILDPSTMVFFMQRSLAGSVSFYYLRFCTSWTLKMKMSLQLANYGRYRGYCKI